MRCAVFGCNVDDQAKGFVKGEYMFFRFPTDVASLKAWESACARKDKFNVKNSRVCSKHFKADDYARNLQHELLGYSPKNRRLLKPGVIPTESLPNKPSSIAAYCSSSERFQRIEGRNRSRLIKEILSQGQVEESASVGGNGLQSNVLNSVGMVDGGMVLMKDVGTSTTHDYRDETIAKLLKQNEAYKKENAVFKQFFTPEQVKRLKDPHTGSHCIMAETKRQITFKNTIMSSDNVSELIKCINFAAEKHRFQRRKNPEKTPYINHPIGVSYILTHEAKIVDLNIIQAAILHDTVEDTETTFEEIETLFGKTVRDIVFEVTDDKTLPKMERKRLQIEKAPKSSYEAKLVKLADKLHNLRDLERIAPEGWSEKRVQEYFEWSKKVVDGLRGVNSYMEASLDLIFSKRNITD